MESSTETRKKVVHVLNGFRSGAIPHILRDIHPTISERFDVEIAVIGRITDTDRVCEEFRDLNIKVHALNCSRWNISQAYFRLLRLLRALNPDIIHGHMGRAEMLAPLCRTRNAKVLATHHNVKEGYHLATRMMSHLSNTMLDGRTCVSNAVRHSWHGSDSRATVIYNPVDASKFSVGESQRRAVRTEFGISDSTFLLVSVGRLNKQKAHSVLVRALHRLRATGEDCRLVIAGRGEEELVLRAEIRELGLEPHVIMAGFRNDVPSLTAAADVFVFPSLWEGLGIAVLEAMAAGTAVAASDIPALRECIAHEENGLLSPPGDEISLSVNIRRLLLDPLLRKSLGTKAREAVQGRFNAEHIAIQYMSLYDTHLAGKQR
jgi:glycosyltransferase involved in cell wall biosynthesis